MPYRAVLLALALFPALAAAGDIDAAMRCVRGSMTSAFVPATANVEQLANVALARCADEIESAAIALAGAPLVHARIEASRTAVRRELHSYALAVAAGPVTDTYSEPTTASPSFY
jgi:hypothetical protein